MHKMKHIEVKGKQSAYYIFPQIQSTVASDDTFSGRTFIGYRYPDGKRFFIRHFKAKGPNHLLMSLLTYQEALIQSNPGYWKGSIELCSKEEHLFLVREFAEGISLKDLRKFYSFRSNKRTIIILKMFRHLLKGLQQLHEQKVIHCNLKPSNIFLRYRYGKPDFIDPVCVFTDFSMAKTPQLQPPANAKLPVSFMYNAPELLLSKTELIGPATDLYSIAIILYELLKGHHPFRVKHPRVVGDLHISSPIKNFSGIREDLKQIILKATNRTYPTKPLNHYSVQELTDMVQKGIEGRYPSANEMIEDIDTVLTNLNAEISNPVLETETIHPVIVFDDLCVLCSRAVNFLKKRDTAGLFRFAGLSGNTAKRVMQAGKMKANAKSIILLEGEKIYTKSSAFIRIMQLLGKGWQAMVILKIFPAFIRDAVYLLIAKNRYKWWGKQQQCQLPPLYEKFRFEE